MTVISQSPRETEGIARALAKQLPRGTILALSGNLGSGKTVFVRGLARAFGIRQRITSPTFVIAKVYQIPHAKKYFYHFDLYRIRHLRELAELGLTEVLSNRRNLVAIEWPEKVKKILPPHTIFIDLSLTKFRGQRKIKISS